MGQLSPVSADSRMYMSPWFCPSQLPLHLATNNLPTKFSNSTQQPVQYTIISKSSSSKLMLVQLSQKESYLPEWCNILYRLLFFRESPISDSLRMIDLEAACTEEKLFFPLMNTLHAPRALHNFSGVTIQSLSTNMSMRCLIWFTATHTAGRNPNSPP